jgi:hypothetical protein
VDPGPPRGSLSAGQDWRPPPIARLLPARRRGAPGFGCKCWRPIDTSISQTARLRLGQTGLNRAKVSYRPLLSVMPLLSITLLLEHQRHCSPSCRTKSAVRRLTSFGDVWRREAVSREEFVDLVSRQNILDDEKVEAGFIKNG